MGFLRNLIIAALVILTGFIAASAVNAGTTAYDAATNRIIMTGKTDNKLSWSLIETLTAHPEADGIVMYGSGGRMDAMVIIMGTIKQSGLPVYIPEGKICASACALAAVSSETVTVGGWLLFHTGHISGYPQGATLNEINSAGQRMVIAMLPHFVNIGFKLDFFGKLVRYTGPNKWVVVTDIEQINECRVTDASAEELMRPCYIAAPIKTTEQVVADVRAWYKEQQSKS